MEKSTQTNSTSTNAIRIIANDDIAEAGEIIDDMKNLEKKHSNEEISETEKTIKDIQSFLLLDRTPFSCGSFGCYCCHHHNRNKEHIYMFLKKLMNFEAEKYNQLRTFFSRQEEKKTSNNNY